MASKKTPKKPVKKAPKKPVKKAPKKATPKPVKKAPPKPVKKPAKPVKKPRAVKPPAKRKKPPAKRKKPAKRQGKPGKPKQVVTPIRKRGFDPIAETNAAAMANAMRTALGKAKDSRGGMAYVFHNRNNTVDGQWRLDIPRGVEPKRIATIAEEALRRVKLPGAYVSVGVEFPTPEIKGPRHYDRISKMLSQAIAYAQEWGKRHKNFATAKGRIIGGLANNKRRKPTAVVVRIHWNPDGIRPSRDDMYRKG